MSGSKFPSAEVKVLPTRGQRVAKEILRVRPDFNQATPADKQFVTKLAELTIMLEEGVDKEYHFQHPNSYYDYQYTLGN
jgi:hypothetical protein